MAHADDDEVKVGYSSSRNITFREDADGLGVTWGEWRTMSRKEQDETLAEYLFSLVDVYLVDDEG